MGTCVCGITKGHNYVGGVCKNCGGIDETQVSDAELIAALEANLKDKLIKAVYIGVTLDSSRVDTECWYVTIDSQSLITLVQYSFVYHGSSTSEYYFICSAEFSSSVSRKDIRNSQLGNVSYNCGYYKLQSIDSRNKK